MYLAKATRVGADCGHNVAGASTRAAPAESRRGVGGSSGGDSGTRGVRVLGDRASEGTIGGTSGGTGVSGSVGGTCAGRFEGCLGGNVENTTSGVGHVGDHDGQAATNACGTVDRRAGTVSECTQDGTGTKIVGNGSLQFGIVVEDVVATLEVVIGKASRTL